MKSPLFLALAVLCGASFAGVRPSAVFSDHAVLLRSADTPVFGKADPGERIRVTCGAASADGVADAAGKWLVRLDLSKAGAGPFELKVNDFTAHDVVVGEVWLASGQSNMSFIMQNADDYETEKTLTNHLIRCFQVSDGAAVRPCDEIHGRWLVAEPGSVGMITAVGYQFAKCLHARLKTPVGLVSTAVGAATIEAWCDPQTMSVNPAGKMELDRQIAFAAGYRDYERDCDAKLRDWEKKWSRTDRPHGGMPAAGWRPLQGGELETFGHGPGAIWLKRTLPAGKGGARQFVRRRFVEKQWLFDTSSVEVYWNGKRIERVFPDDPIEKNTELYPLPSANAGELSVRIFNADRIYDVLAYLFADGARLDRAGWMLAEEFALPEASAAARQEMPPRQKFCLRQHWPTGLFNGRTAGLVPMGLSGVIWYQGESNTDHVETYDALFVGLIKSWRQLFRKPLLPFAWCQLSAFTAKAKQPDTGNDGWPKLRDEQTKALRLPMTGQAVLLDVGEEWDIHPRDKRTPGRRLAAWALNAVYGCQDVAFAGPRATGARQEGSSAVVSFADCGGGLVTHDLGKTYPKRTSVGEYGPVVRNSPTTAVEGFAIAGADGVWHWADVAEIVGTEVRVSSGKVPHPRSVRYGWSINPWVNLYNGDGFPAVPFTLPVAVEYRVTTDMTDAQRNACVSQMASGDRMVFTRGVHRFRQRLYVGNKKGLVFEGEDGAVLQLHCNPAGAEEESSGAFFLDGCEHITIRNLGVTTDNFIGNQGTVLGIDKAAHTLLFKVDSIFPVTGDEHYFQLNTVNADGVPDDALQVHEPIHKVAGTNGGRDRHVGMGYDVVGERLVRIHVPKWASIGAVTNGHRMLVRYFRNGESPFSIARCSDVTVQDVEIDRSFTMSMVVAPPSRDLTLRRFNIRPAKGSGLYAASNSDGIHILGLGGRFVMDDCHFKGLGDDALNIHSMAAEVKSQSADGAVALITRGPDRTKERRLPDGWAKAGDEVEIYGSDYTRKGKTTLAAYDERTRTGRLAANGPMPQKGDLLVNTAFYPSVSIRNCSAEATRARAFLLQTHDVRIENCVFRGLPLPALIFAVDFVVWNEAGPTENAVVSGCRFERCANSYGRSTLGAIVVKADHDGGENDRPAGIHRNIRFLNNTFEDCGSSGIYVAATDGVELDGNTFARCSSNARLEPHNRCDIRLRNCRNVKLGQNKSDRGSLLMADPPLPAASGRDVDKIKASGRTYKQDKMQGFDRIVFDFEGREAWLVEPKTPAPDGRWIWCMEWPCAFQDRTAVKALLEAGYRWVAFNPAFVGILYPEKHAKMRAGNQTDEMIACRGRFHDYLVRTLGLNQKCGLVGMSWGGFYSVRYASARPQDVVAAYLDAPLLDFSTLDGFASADGQPTSLMKELHTFYEFVVPGYVGRDDPFQSVNRAAPIARAGIPLLLLYGAKDTTVPPDKNCLLFAPRFEQCGGNLTLVRRSEFGHHPHGVDPADVSLIVNFFSRAYATKGSK